LSILLVVLSGLQFREASKQRYSADEAVRCARAALTEASVARADALQADTDAKVAKDEAERARDDTVKTVEHLASYLQGLIDGESGS
jgi:hypothetical protein